MNPGIVGSHDEVLGVGEGVSRPSGGTGKEGPPIEVAVGEAIAGCGRYSAETG